MSVLLEALKKAAAEKQLQTSSAKKSTNQEGLSLSDEVRTPNVASEEDSTSADATNPSKTNINSKTDNKFSLEPVDDSDNHPASNEVGTDEKDQVKPVLDMQTTDLNTVSQNDNENSFKSKAVNEVLMSSDKSSDRPKNVFKDDLAIDAEVKAGHDIPVNSLASQQDKKITENNNEPVFQSEPLNKKAPDKKSWLNPVVEPLPSRKKSFFSKPFMNKANAKPEASENKNKAKNIWLFLSKNRQVAKDKVNTKSQDRKQNVAERSFTPLIYLLFAVTFFLALFYYAFHYYSNLQSEYNADVQRLMNIVNAHSEQARTPVSLVVVDNVKLEKSSEQSTEKSITSLDAKIPDEDDKQMVNSLTALALSQDQELSDSFSSISEAEVSPNASTSLAARTTNVRQQNTLSAKQDTSKINIEKVEGSNTLGQLAYEAYQSGNYTKAFDYYNQLLMSNPNSRVAKLGLAAVAVHRGQYETAFNLYRELLDINPNDKGAQFGMASLRGVLSSSNVGVNDLKSLLNNNPYSSEIQFAMGNAYAQTGDWFKAQQYYFESVKLDVSNPHYRVNLAISLDHLGDFNSALEHYKYALALAGPRDTQIIHEGIRQRVLVLERFFGGKN